MSRASILALAAVWKLGLTSAALSYPIKENYVEMIFDDQPLNLFVDSGSSESYLVYGGWYESLYGSGSCKDLISGCYFCPPTDPCDLKGLLTQNVVELGFADEDIVRFVYRAVTLKLGDEREITNLQIGLMVGSTRAERGVQPIPLLGLSLPSPGLEREQPSLLRQLVKARVVSKAAFSVHVSEALGWMTGQLMLGEDTGKIGNVTTFRLGEFSRAKRVVGISASAVLVKRSSDHVQEFSKKRKHSKVIIDTGTCETVLPTELFVTILETLEAELGQHRVGWLPGTLCCTRWLLDAYVGDDGYIWVGAEFDVYVDFDTGVIGLATAQTPVSSAELGKAWK
ncbi:hypothetical protein FOZ62_015991, partial [Perkinsus olseni]